ncbi:hypothetical protein LTR56_019680 [Elasticomyces elasticus]|nr:hypothetical protein LTR56_019680 [Elasticomyces elasticus]KAK3633981.1 hypothetical protein LTR22_019848 [Elasticomyces elasticus]KAK4911124.1 hypothetical protein LTR49_020291 [Elasticomyces elasticus]KAK5750648.1 hypothetical protein LTS12_019269 [Elasticomyces elasticus]
MQRRTWLALIAIYLTSILLIVLAVINTPTQVPKYGTHCACEWDPDKDDYISFAWCGRSPLCYHEMNIRGYRARQALQTLPSFEGMRYNHTKLEELERAGITVYGIDCLLDGIPRCATWDSVPWRSAIQLPMPREHVRDAIAAGWGMKDDRVEDQELAAGVQIWPWEGY